MKIEKKMGLRAYESVSFSLQDCEVPAENLLGGEEREAREPRAPGSGTGAYGATMGALNSARVGVAASALGIARAALDEGRRFAKDSGALKHPRVRDELERSLRKLRAARLATLKAAWLVDQRRPNVVESSMAKLLAAETYVKTTEAGMQVMGGYGYNMEFDMQRHFRDSRAATIAAGSSQIQRNLIAGLMGLKSS